MEIALRDYQTESIESLRLGIRFNLKNQILCLPTGAGKTQIAAFLLKECFKKGMKAIFVCDRITLINQASDTLDRYDIPHGIIQSNHWRYRPYERIQVASAQTLLKRSWPEANLVIVDECHALMKTVTDKLAEKKAVAIGLTATPLTKGLGKHYESVVTVTTLNKLTADKFLVPFRVFSASEPDMEGAKIVAGEWTEDEAAKRAMPLVGDCVSEYVKHGENRKFIAFGCNVAHCEELHRQFTASGIVVELFTYRTTDTARADILTEYKKPDSKIRGLISVSALSKGFDVEDVACIIVARPLRSSLAEHIQILGRGLRPFTGKKDCLVLDHAGNFNRFWNPMWEFFEHGIKDLDNGKKPEKKKAEKREIKPKKCPTCFHIHKPMPSCPECGFLYPKKQSEFVHEIGDLNELIMKQNIMNKAEIYAELRWIAEHRGWNPGRLAHSFI